LGAGQNPAKFKNRRWATAKQKEASKKSEGGGVGGPYMLSSSWGESSVQMGERGCQREGNPKLGKEGEGGRKKKKRDD